ncbi:MAG: aspartate kinase [Candidatus Porifericomitaceae bacterium WSBS_2022_MAG_OTU9]
MALLVQKFGGTSVADPNCIRNVAAKVAATKAAGNEVVVVVSAMAGETDRLESLANSMVERPSGAAMDMLLSTGEQVSVALMSMALFQLGIEAVPCTGYQAKIHTDNRHLRARITGIDPKPMQQAISKGQVPVVAGFQGSTGDGTITTLGRGGSDTTATALAAVLQAAECQIYTDVDGVYTADPRILPKARKLDRLTFEEMLELSGQGSRVLQTRAVEFASKYNVPIRVLSSFGDGMGTLVSNIYEEDMEQAKISGIAHNRDEAKLTLVGVPDSPGIAHDILGPVADAGIEVDMIVQNVGERQTTDFTFTVHRRDYTQAMELLEPLAKRLGAQAVRGDDSIVKVALVGVGMRSHSGIASTMFKALAGEGINIMMISTSEIKISVVIQERHLESAVRVLHDVFELEASKEIKEMQ